MSSLPRRLLLATGNPAKVAEWRRLLPDLELVVREDLPSPVEDGATCADNALLKARAAFAATGLPSLADDVGLWVEALGGRPGLELRRWADELGGWPAARAALAEVTGSPASYGCGIAWVHGGGERTAEVRVPGTIVAARGEGPGVEACFVAEGTVGTLPELSPEERSRVHHRHVALRTLTEAG